jgi:hypothetical protein
MLSTRLAEKFGCSVVSAFIFLTIFFGIVGIFCWPYGINTWLVFAGKPAIVQWYKGFLIGCIPVFGKYSVIFAILTWILMMFL